MQKSATEESERTGKRTRKEKSVVFDLPDDLSTLASQTKHSRPLSSSLLLAPSLCESDVVTLNKEEIKCSALKQATTMTKNVTAFGKEVLLSSDAPRVVMRYTQGAYQKLKA
uniref:Syntaxin-binding protein 2 n=1 Tax=Lygus hesperus TaxID=30085 RepID=A0A0A9ZFK3_LYGHE